MDDLQAAFRRQAIRKFPNGVLVLFDEDLRYRVVGPETLPFSGREAAEMVGQTIHDLFPAETAGRLEPELRATIDGDARSFDVSYGDRIHHIETQPTAIDGEPYGVLVTQDVTSDRHTTQQLELLNRIFRHDIRNDMAIILGWAELLTDHVDAEGEKHLRKILDSGRHVVELTETAREYVETLTGEEEFDLKPVPICSVLESELTLRRESFPEADFSTPDEIPAVEVTANEMLGSVFRNLLNNAVQHNDKDTPVVEVTCETSETDVVVRIADNGPGIPDDQKESIFGEGEKGLESAGTGIGLYLSRRLVEQFNGAIRAEDNDPEGAVFVVRLPRAQRTRTRSA